MLAVWSVVFCSRVEGFSLFLLFIFFNVQPFFRYNKDKNCHHLIANALEKDGENISSNLLSRTLKQFGFKPPRKRISRASSTDQIRDSEVTPPNMDDLEGSSASRKPL